MEVFYAQYQQSWEQSSLEIQSRLGLIELIVHSYEPFTINYWSTNVSILLNLVYDPHRGYHWLPHDGFHLHLLDFKGVRLSPHDKHFVVSGGQVVDLLRGLGLLRLSLERLWRLVQETNLNEVLLGKYLNPTVSSVAIGLSYKGCCDRKLQG